MKYYRTIFIDCITFNVLNNFSPKGTGAYRKTKSNNAVFKN